jgi:tRNA threonylcarbamoyladenosine biosynthesis protein TsaE
MSSQALSLHAPDEDAMVALGARLAPLLTPGLVIYLEGGLGAGKTTFCRGLVRGLGHVGAVKSPTYTLVEPYALSALTVYHFDLYRLGDPEELEFLGIRDYFLADTLCLIEWPERGKGILPPADLVINIEAEGLGRRLQLVPSTSRGMAVVERWRGVVAPIE